MNDAEAQRDLDQEICGKGLAGRWAGVSYDLLIDVSVLMIVASAFAALGPADDLDRAVDPQINFPRP
jgi:hypothetical protein